MTRAEQLAVQRLRLLEAGAEKRAQLIQQRDAISQRLQGVDRGIEIVRKIVSHPFLVIGAIATVIAIGPFKVMRWIGQGIFWIRMARGASGIFKSLGLGAASQPNDVD